MRRQPEPHLVPGNYPAAQRYIRRRKPPRILLCCIGTITCLLFLGSAAMLAIGYLNPFGTIGLTILGVGAVVYFGTILFLVLTCLWVERKYPGMQPLSFKLLSRKQPRMTPTTFTNPNISGQVPTNTISGYRLHNEVPLPITGYNEQKTDNIPSAPKDTAKKKTDKQPSHGFSLDPGENSASLSNSLEILQEENSNGGSNGKDIPEVTAQIQTTNEDVNISGDKGGKYTGSDATKDPTVSSITDEKKNDLQPKQNENDNASSVSPKRKRRVQPKIHHVEVPFEDYPSSDNSSSALINNKESSLNIQEPKPKEATPQNSNTAENKPSHSTDASIPTITKPTMNQETPSNMPQTYKKDQQSAQKASAPLPGRKNEDSSNAQKGRSFESCQMHHESSQLASNSELHRSPAVSPAQVKKHIKVQEIQNSQESTQQIKGLIHTNSASPHVVRNETLHKRHEMVPQSSNAVQKVTMVSPKLSPVSARKLLGLKKSNIQTSQDSRDLDIDNAQPSSLLPSRKNAFHHKHDRNYEPQNMSIDKDRVPKLFNLKDFPEALPIHTQKSESPERQKKFGNDKLPHSSPKNSRRTISESPPRYQQRSSDISPKAQRNPDQTLTTTSRPKKEEIHKRQTYQSSQSSDVPSSTSSSPPRHRQRSPDVSPNVQMNPENSTSRTQVFYSKKVEFHKSHTRQSSPSSQSSDQSSPSSSPSRHRRRSPESSPKFQRNPDGSMSRTKVLYPKKEEFYKRHSHQSSPSQSSNDFLPFPQKTSPNSPDISNKIERNKDIHKTKVELSSKSKKYELDKMHNQQSSQTKDVPKNSISSPLNAKKLLQYNKAQQSKSA